jgi:hypothetical protein
MCAFHCFLTGVCTCVYPNLTPPAAACDNSGCSLLLSTKMLAAAHSSSCGVHCCCPGRCQPRDLHQQDRPLQQPEGAWVMGPTGATSQAGSGSWQRASCLPVKPCKGMGELVHHSSSRWLAWGRGGLAPGILFGTLRSWQSCRSSCSVMAVPLQCAAGARTAAGAVKPGPVVIARGVLMAAGFLQVALTHTDSSCWPAAGVCVGQGNL